jgi:drug/metabolite transporter (DMT)-like permease
VLAVVLALASAIGYGSSDFAAGLASRSAPVIQITLLASVISGVIVAAALPFAASPGPDTAALAWGFGAGLGGTLGAFALYLGFRHAAFSVAGPLSAVASAGFSVLAGLLYGERPTTLALTGIVLALPAIVGVSVSAGAEQAEDGDAEPEAEDGDAEPEAGHAELEAGHAELEAGHAEPQEAAAAGRQAAATGRQAAGVVYGLLAGACFALLFIGLDQAGSDSGLWPVAAAAVGELAAALVATVAVRSFTLCGGRARLLAVTAGAGGAAGTILFFLATHHGFLAVTAVLTSLYPAATIVLARTVLGERLTGLRLAGLGLAGLCVSLIAVGGAG